MADRFELYVQTYGGQMPPMPCSLLLGATARSVGRSPGCHLSLLDPERLISRAHLALWVDPQHVVHVRNISKSSAAFVDGHELVPGAERALDPAQRIVLGRYLLGLREVEAGDEDADAVGAPTAATSMVAQAAARPRLPEPGLPRDPVDMAEPIELGPIRPIPAEFDVFADPSPIAGHGAADAADRVLDELSPERAASRELLSELPAFDPRGPAESAAIHAMVGMQEHAPASDAGILGLLGEGLLGESRHVVPAAVGGEGGRHGNEIDSLFALPHGVEQVPGLLAELESAAAPLPAAASIARASEACPATELPAEAARAPSVPQTKPPKPPTGSAEAADMPGAAAPSFERNGHVDPVVVLHPPPASRERSPAPPAAAASAPARARGKATSRRSPAALAPPADASAGGADATALRAAFARGCGMPEDRIGEFDPASVEALGRLLGALVTGTLQLIHARSSTKHEMRANVTIIAPSGNNPLKFAPDAQAALLQLLGRGLPGFMPPEQAVADAFEDLCAHQVGLLAGSRTAMYTLASRLAPERISELAGGPRGLAGLLPGARKARLWEHYTDSYAALLGEAREEFEAVFQSAFARAYEGEVDRLQAGGGQ
jgi:FHA domain-containing protein